MNRLNTRKLKILLLFLCVGMGFTLGVYTMTPKVKALEKDKAMLQQDIADVTEQLEIFSAHIVSLDGNFCIVKKELLAAKNEIEIYKKRIEELTTKGNTQSKPIH